jgi:hypothetical protein
VALTGSDRKYVLRMPSPPPVFFSFYSSSTKCNTVVQVPGLPEAVTWPLRGSFGCAHSCFHELFRFWYVWEYKYGSILWLEDGNLYLRLRTMSHTIYAAKFEQTIIPMKYSNSTSFFRFVNKRAIYRLGIISLAHAPVHVTDIPVVNVHVDELSSARIRQHKLCATLSATVNINYRSSNQSILPYLYS